MNCRGWYYEVAVSRSLLETRDAPPRVLVE
jgi:hypothetical protein